MSIKLRPGMFMLAKTKQTPQGEEIYGRVLYVIKEVGLQRPLRDPVTNEPVEEQDGVKVEMLGGTGPSARAGQIIMDWEEQILKNVREGVVEIIQEQQAVELRKRFKTVADIQKGPGSGSGTKIIGADMPPHGGSGVIDLG